MTRVESPHEVGTTIDRLAAAARARDMTIFARIDHAAGAAAAGLAMLPTELLIFGNARAGTPLMRAAATAAIDLPLKAVAWQDEHGTTWLGYNDPAWIARRHAASAEPSHIAAMTAGLLVVVQQAIGPK